MVPQPADLELLSDAELAAEYATALAELGIETEEQARLVLDVETAALIEQLSLIEVAHPLAAAVLWEKPDEAWDQRRLVLALVNHHLTLVLGGNGSGKTYAILELTVAQALGGDHPAVRAWLTDNALPLDLIPPGPGNVGLVAPSAALSIEFHRKDIHRLLPAEGVHWRMKDAPQEATVEIRVPGYSELARIYFKSVDQKHRAFKGGKFRFYALSEEPEGEEGKLVVEECLRATARVGGRVVIECTPQSGLTWVHDDLYVDRMYGCEVVELDSEYNVLVDDHDALMAWLASLPAEQREMRQRGRFTDRRGLVYKPDADGFGGWSRALLVDDYDLPAHLPRMRVADWGQTTKNGTAVLWSAIEEDGTLVLYREYYKPGQPDFAVHAREVRLAEPRIERISEAWADHEPEAISEFAAVGLHFKPADKAVESGISRCAQRLYPVGGKVRLKVFKSLRRFVFEIENYRADPNKRDGAPIKKDDHILDCWRYTENGLAASEGTRAAAAAVRRGTAAWLDRLGRRR